jgi:hypothetical protein
MMMKRLASRPRNKRFHIFSFFYLPNAKVRLSGDQNRPLPNMVEKMAMIFFFGGGLYNMIGQWNSDLLHNLKKSDFLAALFLSFVLSYKRG